MVASWQQERCNEIVGGFGSFYFTGSMEISEIRLSNAHALMKQQDLGVSDFGRKIGRDQAQASAIVGTNPKRNIGSRMARHIEECFGLQRGWLDQYHVHVKPGGVGYTAHAANISTGPDIRQELPLISWVRAGAWSEVQDPLEPGEHEELIPVTRRYSNRAFCLRIQGDSMQASECVSFPDGGIICVEPSQDARNGSFVVARLDDSMEATFKQLVIDGDQRYLKPLNPRYPLLPITGELTICGVVRQLVMNFD